MSVRPSAKPIVRRQTATARPSKVLLTIPDLRAEVLSANTPSPGDSENLAGSSIDSVPFAEEESSHTGSVGHDSAGDDVLESLEMAVAYQQATQTVDTDPEQPNAAIAPPNPPIGAPARDTPKNVDDGDAPPSQHDITTTTQDSPFEFSKNLKQNLGILGTIAASIIVCTLVARSMRQDVSRELTSTGSTAEFIDVAPAVGTQANQPESVTAVTPNFEATQLQPQGNFQAQTNRPLNQQLNQPPRQQLNRRGQMQALPAIEQPTNRLLNALDEAQAELQSQKAAVQTQLEGVAQNVKQNIQATASGMASQLGGQRTNSTTTISTTQATPLAQLQTAATPDRSASVQPTQAGGFDPFALPAFGGRPSTSPNVAPGNGSQPNRLQTEVVQLPNPRLNSPQVGTFQTFAQQQQQGLPQLQSANQPISTRQQNQFEQGTLTIPQIQQPQTSALQQPQSPRPQANRPNQFVNGPANSPQPGMFQQTDSKPRLESNPYPSTDGASFQQIASELQQGPRQVRSTDSQVDRFAPQFRNPQTPAQSQAGRTADRGNAQGFDARFETSPEPNTGVFR